MGNKTSCCCGSVQPNIDNPNGNKPDKRQKKERKNKRLYGGGQDAEALYEQYDRDEDIKISDEPATYTSGMSNFRKRESKQIYGDSSSEDED